MAGASITHPFNSKEMNFDFTPKKYEKMNQLVARHEKLRKIRNFLVIDREKQIPESFRKMNKNLKIEIIRRFLA